MTDELVSLDGGALTQAQTAVLTQKTPKEVIRHRPGPGGKVLSYCGARLGDGDPERGVRLGLELGDLGMAACA
jgi:hypothetical protein